jgi:hypothetical protein
MTGAEIILTVAVILGPTLAVGVSLFMERRRNQRERRMDIFRTLMRTRMGTSKLSFDHVSALNLVEVEFRNDKVVHDAWKEYLSVLCPIGRNENADPLSMNKSLGNLLQHISRTLGYKIEGLEIFGGGYTPKYWDTIQIDAEWQYIRRYLIALSEGDKVLPVKVLESTIPQKDR